jgi:hypothetical protein
LKKGAKANKAYLGNYFILKGAQMSYSIVYDKKFIKTDSGIIPLVLTGCSNVTVKTLSGREKLERDWAVFNFDNSLAYSPDDLMSKVREEVPSTYNQHFKYNGKWVDDKAYIRFFESGIRNALTLEETAEKYYQGRVLSISMTSAEDALFSAVCHSTAELEAAVAEIRRIKQAYPKNITTYLNCGFPGAHYEKLKPRNPKRKSSKASTTQYYCVTLNGNFVRKHTSKHIFLSAIHSARRFRSQNEARTYIDSYKLQRHGECAILNVGSVIKYAGEVIDYFWTGNGFSQAQSESKQFITPEAAQKEILEVIAPERNLFVVPLAVVVETVEKIAE